MSALPNPFAFTAPHAVEMAAASSFAPVDGAAADTSPGDVLSSLPSGESDLSVTPDLAPGGNRFVLDERAFMEAIEPLPLFLQAPIAVLEVLAGY